MSAVALSSFFERQKFVLLAFNRLIFSLISWLSIVSIGWLIKWSSDWLINWFIDYLTHILFCLSVFIYRFISTDRLTSLRPKPPVAILPLGKWIWFKGLFQPPCIAPAISCDWALLSPFSWPLKWRQQRPIKRWHGQSMLFETGPLNLAYIDSFPIWEKFGNS